jgi:hypothetical protein
MAISRSDKVKKLMGNFVGASASVAVVAAVASFSIRVEASFLDVTVFQNRAFYQLEVKEIVEIEGSGSLPEETPEPVNTPVRLRVQNQWDDFFLPLVYGYNEGFIEPLRPNQQYTLTIELQQAVAWSTLATRTFNTQPATAAVISEVLETTSPLNPLLDLSVSLLTQDGGTPAEAWQLQLLYGDTTDTRSLVVGQNNLNFEALPHVNAPIVLNVIANFPNEQRLITSRTFTPTIYVDGHLDVFMPNLTTLTVNTSANTTLTNPSYTLTLTSEGLPPLTQLITTGVNDFNNLTQGVNYSLSWDILYGNNQRVTLLTTPIQTILMPIFVLTINQSESGQSLTLTIDNDVAFESFAVFFILDNVMYQDRFVLVSTNPSASTYTLQFDVVFPPNLTLTLVGRLDAPYAYPITLQTIVFQGGQTL